MKIKRKTINIDQILWAEIQEASNGTAVLIFHSSKYKIKLHINRDMVGYIAGHLWQFVRKEEAAITQTKIELMGEG